MPGDGATILKQLADGLDDFCLKALLAKDVNLEYWGLPENQQREVFDIVGELADTGFGRSFGKAMCEFDSANKACDWLLQRAKPALCLMLGHIEGESTAKRIEDTRLRIEYGLESFGMFHGENHPMLVEHLANSVRMDGARASRVSRALMRILDRLRAIAVSIRVGAGDGSRADPIAPAATRQQPWADGKETPPVPGRLETETKAERTTTGVVVAICVSAILIIAVFEYSVYKLPWNWLRNHPNSFGIQVGVDIEILLILLGLVRPKWRKSWWPTVLIPLAIVVVSLLGGPTGAGTSTQKTP